MNEIEDGFCSPHTLKQAQEAMEEGQDSQYVVEKLVRNEGIARLANECKKAEHNNRYLLNEKKCKRLLTELPPSERNFAKEEPILDEEEEKYEDERKQEFEGYRFCFNDFTQGDLAHD